MLWRVNQIRFFQRCYIQYTFFLVWLAAFCTIFVLSSMLTIYNLLLWTLHFIVTHVYIKVSISRIHVQWADFCDTVTYFIEYMVYILMCSCTCEWIWMNHFTICKHSHKILSLSFTVNGFIRIRFTSQTKIGDFFAFVSRGVLWRFM